MDCHYPKTKRSKNDFDVFCETSFCRTELFLRGSSIRLNAELLRDFPYFFQNRCDCRKSRYNLRINWPEKLFIVARFSSRHYFKCEQKSYINVHTDKGREQERDIYWRCSTNRERVQLTRIDSSF